MNSFWISLNAVLPVVIFIFFGFFLKSAKYASSSTFSEVNKLVFSFFLPLSIYKNIIDSDFSKSFRLDLLIFASAAYIILTFIFYLLVKQRVKDPAKYAVILQCVFRTNCVLLGMPIMASIFGPNSLGMPSILIAGLIPLTNGLGIIVLQNCSDEKVGFKETVVNIFKSPFIIAAVLGFLTIFLNIKLPTFLYTAVSDIAVMANPLAIIAIGGSFDVESLSQNRSLLVLGTLIRLIIVPLIVLTIAILLGYRNIELGSLLIVFATPLAISSYSMSLIMGGDAKLNSQLILTTTVLVGITMFSWIYVLTELGFLI